jgi:hypothetical protein
VPFFAGMMTGETRALVESFATEPELHHPIRGRVKGVTAFERFVSELSTWLAERSAAGEDARSWRRSSRTPQSATRPARAYTHRGTVELRGPYELCFSDGDGIRRSTAR